MKKNYFNFKKIDDSFLITNDFGNYAFLDRQDFQNLIKGHSMNDSTITEELKTKYFIYDDSELDYSDRISSFIFNNKGYLAQATSLHIFVITTACNLQCIYCQANNGSNYSNLFMTREIAKRAVDIALQSPATELDFEFQGGEPLINFPIIKFIVEYAEEHKKDHFIHYSLVSNLTLLTDEIINFLNEYNIAISTSIDGNKLIHDHNRHYSSGEGSFDQVKRSLEKLRGNGISVGAIETTTRYSLKYAKQIIEAYKELDFNGIFIRPLTPLGRANKNWPILGYTAEEYLTFYGNALNEIIRLNQEGYPMREDHAAIFLKKIFGKMINYMELRSPCGGGVGQIAYYADGKIFTCDEARMLYEMGDTAFCIGNVFQHDFRALLNNSICKTVCGASILESIPVCSDCVYQPYCGTCPVVNYALCGDVIEKSPHGYKCKIYKGMLDLLFQIIKKNEPHTMDVLRRWGC
ncbi:His-Xaa-Ser system radical SAM maturase HxsB [Porcincola intestinalis]|uniref:His-Xaa-Ser system radical SAM maturase HxsB n=1 Tax=Porcincola intestinalis TaxID=2606632 RepID=UPI002A7F4CB6|nr:His-Xaa-Ser system radical SAM maturase HxsB [Porcincola intestinalis]MDY4204140.1 His-Xaa-Ser system radical SAM maturase HxsB [Porcincola intestinalis]